MLVPTPTPTAAIAALAVLALPPAPTAFVHELQARDYHDYSSCINRIVSLPCLASYTSCALYQDDEAVLTACVCSYAVPQMGCLSSAVTKGHCSAYYTPSSFDADWFTSHCAGPVPTNLLPVTTSIPSVVHLDYRPVTVVTANLTSAPPTPTYTYAPLYSSTDSLLRGDCGATRYKLLEDTSTVYWAAYVGCGIDMPQCCPWVAAKAETTSTAGVPFAVPARVEDKTLARCPADYTNAAGHCCPSSYWPFPSALGDSGQTPCYMSLARATQPPALTVSLLTGQPAATRKPASAVVNLVWAMSYPAPPPSETSRLRKRTIAGIVVGVVFGVAVLVGAVLVWKYWDREELCVWKCWGRAKTSQPELPPPPAYKLPELQQPPAYSGPAT